MNSKFLIVTGATSTGKTELAVKIAEKYNGEIVSADSRHVYRGMDIGTGKDVGKNSKLKTPCLAGRRENSKLGIKNKKFSIGYRLRDGIPVWLVDIVTPDYRFNLGEYFKLARIVIRDIWQRKKLPIIVGGTGLYIKALIKPLDLINIPPDPDLRNNLEKLVLSDLAQILKKIDLRKYSQMNLSDRHNRRRLIRAIEISLSINKPASYTLSPGWLMVYLTADYSFLKQRIDNRVDLRLRKGVIKEIENLLIKGYRFDLQSFSATPYSMFKPYFEEGESKQILRKIIKEWKNTEHKLAKKQLTWFKKMISDIQPEKIVISDVTSKNFLLKIEDRVDKWYTEK